MAALFFSVIKYLGGAEVQFPSQRLFLQAFLKIMHLVARAMFESPIL